MALGFYIFSLAMPFKYANRLNEFAIFFKNYAFRFLN